jgi:hypothetical protein
VLAPQSQQRASDFPVEIRFVVFHIDGNGGAIILAGGVHGGRIAEAPQVFGASCGIDVGAAAGGDGVDRGA